MRLSVVLAGVAVAQATVDPVRVDPSTGSYVDSHGRIRIFHGMNVVYKETPWLPPTDTFTPTDSLDSETMDNLQKWGFNVVRLGVMWPGVEPSLGEIDQNYLQGISTIATDLAKYGVYTIADLHQDVGSRRFCGEGFPEHYVDAILADETSQMSRSGSFPAPWSYDLDPDEAGMPNLTACESHEFAHYYFTSQVGALWNELYTPGTSLNQGFARFWGAVAEALGDAPHLLAYELLNEPSGWCLNSTEASCARGAVEEVLGHAIEKNYLTPLYQSAAKAIRAAGGKQVILYEPTVLPKIGATIPKIDIPKIGNFTIDGDVFPGPVLVDDDQQGLAYHIYCLPGDASSTINGIICRVVLDIFENPFYGFQEKYKGVAGFMTEFGAVGSSKPELNHINMLLAASDTKLQSWSYWMLKKFHDFTTQDDAESLYNAAGELDVKKLKVLSRTYAQATAGPISNMVFNTLTSVFELDFTVTVTTAPTEIYLNEDLHYPKGYKVTIQPEGCFDITSPMKNYIHLTLASESSCVNQAVKVKITPKRISVVV